MSENKFEGSWNKFKEAYKEEKERQENSVFNKTMKGFTKSAGKTAEGLNSISARAAGQKTIKCPNCRSKNVTFMQNDRKGFSVKKAIGGTILTGGSGSIAGFAGKKGKKDHWHCSDCGRTFKK